MTTDEFLAALAEVAPQFRWVDQNGEIRGYLREVQCHCCNGDYCPISAVIRAWKYVRVNNYYAALNAFNYLKMDSFTVSRIILAADHRGYPELRARILEAVGLAPKAQQHG